MNVVHCSDTNQHKRVLLDRIKKEKNTIFPNIYDEPPNFEISFDQFEQFALFLIPRPMYVLKVSIEMQVTNLDWCKKTIK